jgi:hypothetical protein
VCLTCVANPVLSVHLQRVCQSFYVPCQYRLYASILTVNLNHTAVDVSNGASELSFALVYFLTWNALLVGVNSFKILYLFLCFGSWMLEIVHKLGVTVVWVELLH